jgi:cytochrome c
MRMIRIVLVFLIITFVGVSRLAVSGEGRQATAEEVVAKVREAVALLSREGEKGLANFREPQSSFVWKDSYVFVADCERGIILAHPYQPEREGSLIAAGPTYAAARQPGGGWWAYRFPKPGTSNAVRKVSYLLMVPGSRWIAGAGVYDATTPIKNFEAITGASH